MKSSALLNLPPEFDLQPFFSSFDFCLEGWNDNNRILFVVCNKQLLESLLAKENCSDLGSQYASRNLKLISCANARLSGRFQKFQVVKPWDRRRLRSDSGRLLRFFFLCPMKTCKIIFNKLDISLHQLYIDLCNSKPLFIARNEKKVKNDQQFNDLQFNDLQINNLQKQLDELKAEIRKLKNQIHDQNQDQLNSLFDFQPEFNSYKEVFDSIKQGYFDLGQQDKTQDMVPYWRTVNNSLIDFIFEINNTHYGSRQALYFDHPDNISPNSIQISSWHDDAIFSHLQGRLIKEISLEAAKCGWLLGFPSDFIFKTMFSKIFHWYINLELITKDRDFIFLKAKIDKFHSFQISKLLKYDPMRSQI